MKAYRCSTDIAPLVPSLGARWSWVANVTPRTPYPGKSTPVATEQETGRTSEPVETFWRLRNSIASTKFGTPNRPVRSLVATVQHYPGSHPCLIKQKLISVPSLE